MRLLTALPPLLSVVLLPSLAVADPVQGVPAVNGQSGSAATETPATSPQPGSAQTPETPSQSSPTTGAIQNTGPESVVVRADKVDLDQIECKEVPPKTGSRIGGGRECHSQREWNRIRNESQDITRHQQRMGMAR